MKFVKVLLLLIVISIGSFVNTANVIKAKVEFRKRIKSERKATSEKAESKEKTQFQGKTVKRKSSSSKSNALVKSTAKTSVEKRNQVTKRGKTKFVTLMIILAVTSLVITIATVSVAAWSSKLKEMEYHVIKKGQLDIVRLKISTCTQVGILQMQTNLMRFGSTLKQNIYQITKICKCDGSNEKYHCKQVCRMDEFTKKTSDYLDSNNQSLEELYAIEVNKVCDPEYLEEEGKLNERKQELAKEVEDGMLVSLVTGLISGMASAANMSSGVGSAFEGEIDVKKVFGQGKIGEFLKEKVTYDGVNAITDLVSKGTEAGVSIKESEGTTVDKIKMWLNVGIVALVLVATLLGKVATLLGKVENSVTKVISPVLKLVASFLSLVVALLGCETDKLTPFKCFISAASPMKDTLIAVIELVMAISKETAKSLTIVLAVGSALVDIGVQMANFIQGVMEVAEQYGQLASTQKQIEEIKSQINQNTCNMKLKATQIAVGSFEDQVNTASIEAAISELSGNDPDYQKKVKAATVNECNGSAIYCFLFAKEEDLKSKFGLEDTELSYLKDMTKKGPINDILIASTLKERITLEKLGFIQISEEISTLDNISFHACIGCNTSGFIKVITGVHKVAEADKAKFREPFITNKLMEVNFYKLNDSHYLALLKLKINLQTHNGPINNVVADIKIIENKANLIEIKYKTKNLYSSPSDTSHHFDFSKDEETGSVGGDFGPPNLITKRDEIESIDTVNAVLTDFVQDCNNKNEYVGSCKNKNQLELDNLCKNTEQFSKRSTIGLRHCSCFADKGKLYAVNQVDQQAKTIVYEVLKNTNDVITDQKKAITYYYPAISDIQNHRQMKKEDKFEIGPHDYAFMRENKIWLLLYGPREVVCNSDSCDLYEAKRLEKKNCFCDLIKDQEYLQYDSLNKKEPTKLYVPKVSYLSEKNILLTEYPINRYNWKLCANEHEDCDLANEFSNDAQKNTIFVFIRYGIYGKYIYKNYFVEKNNPKVKCDNKNFGDPNKGEVKRCWYLINR